MVAFGVLRGTHLAIATSAVLLVLQGVALAQPADPPAAPVLFRAGALTPAPRLGAVHLIPQRLHLRTPLVIVEAPPVRRHPLIALALDLDPRYRWRVESGRGPVWLSPFIATRFVLGGLRIRF